MRMVHLNRIALYIGMILFWFCLSACGGELTNHPGAFLQQAIASKLANPEACPGGDASDVQQIVDGATGRSVSLPEGCYRITSTINIPPCTQVVGAGADKTILYRDPEKQYFSTILRITGKSDTACETQISGMALIGVRDTNDTLEDYGLIISDVQDFRVDHSYFEGFGFAGVRVEGVSNGVIDHTLFIDNYKSGIDNLGYGVAVYGDDRWDQAVQLGGAQATFVEDSLFVGNRHAIAANAGAHYVFRDNQVLHSIVACAVDAHGMGYGSPHGTRTVEIYRNVIEDPVYDWCGIGIRGGAGVIFENTIRGYENPILLILEWGTPDRYKSEYPALDQVQDLYIWNNLIQGGASEPQVDETGVGFIEQVRDYFTTPLSGYTPFEYPHPLANGGVYDGVPWPPSSQP